VVPVIWQLQVAMTNSMLFACIGVLGLLLTLLALPLVTARIATRKFLVMATVIGVVALGFAARDMIADPARARQPSPTPTGGA